MSETNWTWRDLTVHTAGDGEMPLQSMVESPICDNLSSAEIVDGKIGEWPDHFLTAPGEEPDADTPRVPVDWTGFLKAYCAALDAKQVL